jgi:hypothetical protein
MSVTQKDFIAEAHDIATHLAPYVHGPVLAPYIIARCDRHETDNPRFDRQRFMLACATRTSHDTTDARTEPSIDVTEPSAPANGSWNNVRTIR